MQNELEGTRIAHASTYGGMMTNFGKNIATKLVEMGADLHFIASRQPIYGLPPPIRELQALGGTFHGVDMKEGVALGTNLLALPVMIMLLRRLRVQVLHTRGAIMGFVGRLAGRIARVPLILHHQDDLFARDSRHGQMLQKVLGRIEATISRLSHRTFFVSEAVLKDAIQFGFRQEECVLVGNDLHPSFLNGCAETQEHKDSARRLLFESGVPHGGFVVGSVGRFLKLKGLDTLIRIAEVICRENPNCYFFVKGEGPLKHELEGQIRDSGLLGRVFLCDRWIPMEQIPALYGVFDLFVLPTRREGFGMVFAEAMAMGVPVVGPRMSPITEVVPEGCGMLVDPENVAAYCRAISTLIRNGEERRALGRRGRWFALDAYGGERSANKVIDVYLEMLKSLARIEMASR